MPWKEKRIESSDIKGMKQIANLIGEIREWFVEKKRIGRALLSKIYLLLCKTCVEQTKKGDPCPFETKGLYT